MGMIERGWEWRGKEEREGIGGEGREGDFQKFEILTASMLCSANLHHSAKFHADRSSRSGDMAVYWFFKMAAVRHLRFLKVENFNCPYPSEGQNAAPCQILCKSVKALRRYGRFRFFKMAAVRHLGFVIRLFWPPTKCILVVSDTVQNLVWIGAVL